MYQIKSIEKTKTTKYTTFKTDTIKVVLVFSISNFFTNKNCQGRKLSAVQLQEFSFMNRKALDHHASDPNHVIH